MRIAICLLAAALTAAGQQLPLQSPETEEFLKNAAIVDSDDLPIGVTRSKVLTLNDGVQIAKAVWKTIDESAVLKRFDSGKLERYFRDSYRCEIAAYELDKILGLGMVPATVSRKIKRQTGSLQLWVDGTITEADRLRQKLEPKDPVHWNRQMYQVRLFHQLTYNADFNNVRNLLCDPGATTIFVIDNSRAFRDNRELLAAKDLQRISRPLLVRLRQLERPQLEQRLGEWPVESQIDGLLHRRDLILDWFDQLIRQQGEDAVVYSD